MKRRQLTTDQQGLVSITVAVVFIAVISLTVLGFSTVTRRNTRETLDRQLSAQAFYAAETGVNDAINVIAKDTNSGANLNDQPDCSGHYTKDGGYIYTNGSEVQYTCQKVTVKTDDQVFTNVNDSSVVIHLQALNGGGSGGNLDEHLLTWSPTDNPAPTASVAKCKAPTVTPNVLPHAADWAANCPYGLLRIDLIPATPAALGSSTAALSNTMTLFLYPQQSAAPAPSYGYSNGTSNIYGGGAAQGLVGTASCDANLCQAKITGLNFPEAYMRVRSLYVKAQEFSVQAESGQQFTNGQAIIDVTGKAQDVLRRIQVRVPIRAGGLSSRSNLLNGAFSDYGLQSDDTICKRFVASPTYNADQCSVITPAAAAVAPPAGNASYDSGDPCNGTCVQNIDQLYHYIGGYRNTSQNLPSQVTGCSWNFGDGTILNNVACYNGEWAPDHTFPTLNPEPPFPQGCDAKPYTVTLTVHLTNGTDAVHSSTDSFPWCWPPPSGP